MTEVLGVAKPEPPPSPPPGGPRRAGRSGRPATAAALPPMPPGSDPWRALRRRPRDGLGAAQRDVHAPGAVRSRRPAASGAAARRPGDDGLAAAAAAVLGSLYLLSELEQLDVVSPRRTARRPALGARRPRRRPRPGAGVVRRATAGAGPADGPRDQLYGRLFGATAHGTARRRSTRATERRLRGAARGLLRGAGRRFDPRGLPRSARALRAAGDAAARQPRAPPVRQHPDRGARPRRAAAGRARPARPMPAIGAPLRHDRRVERPRARLHGDAGADIGRRRRPRPGRPHRRRLDRLPPGARPRRQRRWPRQPTAGSPPPASTVAGRGLTVPGPRRPGPPAPGALPSRSPTAPDPAGRAALPGDPGRWSPVRSGRCWPPRRPSTSSRPMTSGS